MEHYFIAPGAIDCPYVWVAAEFLLDPPPGWMVDWSTAIHKDGTTRGTLVKCEDPQRVWKLTGKYNPVTDGYEAEWPD